MTYSINNSVPFSAINWDSFENRPRINEPMIFCNESNWEKDVKCCMDGYSIDHTLNEAEKKSIGKNQEISFLEQYPCVNGPELTELAFRSSDTTIPSQDKPCDIGSIKAFLKTARKFGFGNFADIFHLEKQPTLSCENLMRMAFRYGALALELGRDPGKKLSSKMFE
jgi:hypothetical protein